MPRGHEHPRVVAIVEAAVRAARSGEPSYVGDAGTIPARVYTDEGELHRERERVFARSPIPIAASGELAREGAVLARELGGVSVVVARGADGRARAFKNACRHRGTRLVREDGCRKALVCPYHAWTFALDGRLQHVPRAASFPDLDVDRMGLVAVPCEERHGLVWAALDDRAKPLAELLGPLDDELAALAPDLAFCARRVEREQRGNWKLLVEAFLEGYHIKPLHKSTIAPFFVDVGGVAERVGPHVRHASPRRRAAEDPPREGEGPPRLRDLATFAYVVFPCSILIAHPDWTSLVVVQPRAPDRFLWAHHQLLPAPPADARAAEHFARSFELIDGGVFQREDLFAVAEMQAGLATGANDVVTFGRLEGAALWFHDALRGALDD